MSTSRGFHGPVDERLLDVRTPSELAFSPDGSTVAFALHATVADVGSYPPSDLYHIGIDARAPEALTRGAWSDRSPVWSPDGSQLALLSDRLTPGHQLPSAMVPGAEPVLAATLTGSAESVAWSGGGDRLVVLAADPGCYGLDWSARAVRGAPGASGSRVIRPGKAQRRLFEIDLTLGTVSVEGEWSDPTSQYVERSPATHAHRCRTPTLVIQGAEDRCTPIGQGWELANAIAATGTEVELVVYPREGHVPMERAHALDAIRRTQAWFDRYLRTPD